MRCVAFIALFFPWACLADSPQKSVVTFSHTEDVGFGQEVFVLGGHADLGANDPARAIKLSWAPGNVWSADIAVESGATINYRFIRRSNDRDAWCDPANSADLTPPAHRQVPAHEAGPYNGKTILYYSSWAHAEILYRDLKTGGGWTQAPMTAIGPGRDVNPGEQTFRIDGLASSGGDIEFIFTDGAGNWDNAPAPPSSAPSGSAPGVPVPYQGLVGPFNYRTNLDIFLVQDGGVFTYRPAASVSGPSQQVHFVTSNQANFPSRNVRVLLPRGYNEHSSKTYPVLILHDGQNVFFPGGAFGTWDADRIADYETRMGRMQECIIVGVDNGGARRLEEYTPPSDNVPRATTVIPGKADAYLAFLVDDLLPWLDANFRVACIDGDGNHVPRACIVAGSSMGGLVSDYLSLSRPDVFGACGVLSPAYWAAPNFQTIRSDAAKLARRIYLYVGTAEGEVSFWHDSLAAYNDWVGDGYVGNTEVLFGVGCGSGHNEPAWSARLPEFFGFVLNPWFEPNWLLEELYPTQLRLDAIDFAPGAQQVRLSFQARRGVAYIPRRSARLSAPWQPLPTQQQWGQVWQQIQFDDASWPADARLLYWKLTF